MGVKSEIRPEARKQCPACGARFVDRSASLARVYCEVCKPPRLAGPAAVSRRSAVRKVRAITGEPLTVEHFKAWTRRLQLKGDEPFELEAWEERFVADVLAALRGSGVREVWLVVPEGNGKSTLVAVLVLYLLEFVPEASIPIAASARDQAEIIYRQASGFERRSPHLAGRFRCKPGLREIVFTPNAGLAKIFASDAGTGDGIIPWPLEVLDELHRHPTLELYRTWAGKLDKENAVLVVISTAGEPGSEFEEVRERMRSEATDQTRDGCFGRFAGGTFVLHEYAVPEGADVLDLGLVKQANPSSRITVESLGAKMARPSFNLSHWRRLTCNLPTRSVEAAVAEREWETARVSPDEWPAAVPVWAGLDLGWAHDTTALVPIWMRDTEFRLFGPATILEPAGDGTMLDPHKVERAITDLHERTPIATLVMDTSHGAQLASWVESELGIPVVARQQTNPLAALDYARFMEALREGWLHHVGDPGLTRHVLNAVARVLPGGAIRFDRPHQSRLGPEQRRRVVDGLTAASMAHSVAIADFAGPEYRVAGF